MAGRSLSLEPRKVATRNPEIKVFDITEIEKHFAENIEFIKTQFQIAEDLINDGKNNEAAEIWRSQIVFLESAFAPKS